MAKIKFVLLRLLKKGKEILFQVIDDNCVFGDFFIHFKRTETMEVDKHLSQEIKSSVLLVFVL